MSIKAFLVVGLNTRVIRDELAAAATKAKEVITVQEEGNDGTVREGGERIYFAVSECDVLVMDGVTALTMWAFGIATALKKDVIIVSPEPLLGGMFRFAMTAGCKIGDLPKLLKKMF